MKLTEPQWKALTLMANHQKINFSSEDGQEAACALHAIGLASVFTDTASSLGLVVGEITDAGRAALSRHPERNDHE